MPPLDGACDFFLPFPLFPCLSLQSWVANFRHALKLTTLPICAVCAPFSWTIIISHCLLEFFYNSFFDIMQCSKVSYYYPGWFSEITFHLPQGTIDVALYQSQISCPSESSSVLIIIHFNWMEIFIHLYCKL